jgi:hypothetical protein
MKEGCPLCRGECLVKDQEFQELKGSDLVILISLILVTALSYGSYTTHIFASEKISSDQIKAEILAYQAAQIFLLKSVEKKASKGRSIASESGSFDGTIGEASDGKPFRFQVIQDGREGYRVILKSETDSVSETPAASFDLKIELPNQPET